MVIRFCLSTMIKNITINMTLKKTAYFYNDKYLIYFNQTPIDSDSINRNKQHVTIKTMDYKKVLLKEKIQKLLEDFKKNQYF